VALPADIDNIHLESILKHKETRPVLSPKNYPKWSLKKGTFGLNLFDITQMFTTDTYLPFISSQKPFYKVSGKSPRNSNQIDPEQLFKTFREIHNGNSIDQWPISLNLDKVVDVSPISKPVTILLKVYIPHLNVMYNHSFHRFNSQTPFDQIWEVFSKITQMKEFYLIQEIQKDITKKTKKYKIPTLQILEPPSSSCPSYWQILSKILANKLSLMIKSQIKNSQYSLSNIIPKKSDFLHCFILVPSIKSIFPKIKSSVADTQITQITQIKPQPIEIPSKPEKINDIEKTASKKKDPKALNINIPTGKRAFPGLSENSSSNDSEVTVKSQKRTQMEDEVNEIDKHFKKKLLYLDLSILTSFLDLFRNFENLNYCMISRQETKHMRKLAIVADISDKQMFEFVYRRFLNEKIYFDYLASFNKNCKPKDIIFANGNIFYLNTLYDKYLNSLETRLHSPLNTRNKNFQSIKCKSIVLTNY
jgi:hypothetical protein